jgi:hypothetical protein
MPNSTRPRRLPPSLHRMVIAAIKGFACAFAPPTPPVTGLKSVQD